MSFDYSQDYAHLDLRKHPEKYRVGRGEQGVLTVQPYKAKLLPLWRFRDVRVARVSSKALTEQFLRYKAAGDFVGMDMARKFLQMGFTRARRYANHSSGRKYGSDGKILPRKEDPEKARAAAVFYKAWKKVEADKVYQAAKRSHTQQFG